MKSLEILGTPLGFRNPRISNPDNLVNQTPDSSGSKIQILPNPFHFCKPNGLLDDVKLLITFF